MITARAPLPAALPSPTARLRDVLRLLLVALAVPVALAACSLPRSAALQGEVLRGTESADSEVQVVAVNRETLAELAAWPRPAGLARESWPGTGASATARLIRAGDLLSLAVWDSQRDSLLTTETQRVVNMENIAVSTSGRIFIPYVGDVMVSGMTAEQARADIQRRMEPIVPDAQVQLGVTPGAGNTIDVVTGVATPGRYPLAETSPTILSVLAEAGGIAPTLRNPLVRLQRAGQSYMIPASRLFADPAQDVQLRGGDRILVEPDNRNFIALGAAGRQEVVYFERESITALDALSTIGGVSESRGNLQGLLVLREYPASAVRETGSAPRKPQVIFTFDLTHADGLFAAQRFQIAPNDVVLATESPFPLISQALTAFRVVRQISR